MDALPWNTIPRMLRSQALDAPDAVAVSDQGTTLTVSDLYAESLLVARALQAVGVERGDRVGIWAPNCAPWVVTAFGIWAAGAVVVPLSTRFKGIEAGDLLRRTGVRVLFAAEGFLGASYVGFLSERYGQPKDGRPFQELDALELVVTLDPTGPRDGLVALATFLEQADRVSEMDGEARADSVAPEDLCEVLSTSGTTGLPKGVMLEHHQMLRAYWDWSQIAGLSPGDRYPIVSPFAHGFGINAGILACAMRQATMVPVSVFDPDAALDLVESERVSLLAGPPNLFSRIVHHPDLPRRDVSSLRIAIVGAAEVPEQLVHEMNERLGLERIVNAYGLIEGSVVTMTRPEDSVAVVSTTTGRPVPGVELRIVDDRGSTQPPGERGEILVRGYGVTRGYWDSPKQTREALSDGWLRTGDVGVLDGQGNLSIVGRKKDMFIAGGFNAYPAEIENLLLRHPDLAQAAVIAVPHDELGEVGWAFVVPESGADPTPDVLTAWARQNMSNYKVPRRVIVVPELPHNANGKLDKTALRQQLAEVDPQEAAPSPHLEIDHDRPHLPHH